MKTTLSSLSLEKGNTNRLNYLPPELRRGIFKHVINSLEYEALKSLNAIRDIDKTSKADVSEDRHLRLQHRFLSRLVPMANEIPQLLLSDADESKILGLLSPEKRTATVAFALDKENSYRTMMITGLSSGLSYLDESDRMKIVDAALRDHKEINGAGLQDVNLEDTTPHPSKALAQLCAALPNLDTAQGKQVIDAVLILPNGKLKATLIARMGAVMEHMSESLRTSIVSAFLKLDGEFKPVALTGLSAAIAMGQLSEAHHSAIVNDVLGLEESAKGPAIAALGPAIGRLSTEQHKDIVSHLLAMQDEPKSLAIAGLGAAMIHLNESLRDDIFTAAQNLTFGKLGAIGGLTEAMANGGLNTEQCKYIVDLGLDCPNEVVRSILLSKMGPALANVEQSLRPNLLNAAFSLTTHDLKVLTLECMGAAMPELDAEDRRRLVAGGLNMPDDESTYKVIRGFSQWPAYVSKDQLPDVINTVLAMKEKPYKALSLAAMGAMRESLSEKQWNELADAATEFEDDPGFVYKAKALTGLHR